MPAVDLSNLPSPPVVEEISYDIILAAMLADLAVRDPALDISPSDPAQKILEVAAYREMLMRAEMNDRAKGLLLAYATGADLDHVGVTYYRTARLLIAAGDANAVPPIDPTYESDDDYRDRLLLADDSYSTAGPEAAYIYWAKSASADVKDVSVTTPVFSRIDPLTPEQQAALPVGAVAYSLVDAAGLTDPTPASVVVTVLSRIGDGTPDQTLLDTVTAALGDDVRPMTDEVIVQAATIITYTVNATLTVYRGYNNAYVRSLAEQGLQDYVDSTHALGNAPTQVGVTAALKVPGVHDVVLNDTGNGTDMTANIAVTSLQAALCTGITVTVGGEY